MARSLWLVIFLAVLLLVVVFINDSSDWQVVESPLKTTAIPASTRLKISVSQTGIYRLYMNDLIQAGVEPGDVDDEKLVLSTGNFPVPIYFDHSGQFIFFYGLSPSSRYDAFHYYILEWGDVQGSPMGEESAGSVLSDEVVTSTLRLEENHLYVSRGVDQVGEPWFWNRLVSGDAVIIKFTLPVIRPGGGNVRVRLWGATRDESIDPDHRIRVELNGYPLGIVEWDGETAVTGALAFEENWLKEGANQLEMILTGDTGSPIDQSYLDWIEIDYNPETRPAGDMLAYESTAGRLAPEGSRYLFDVTDPENPVFLSQKEGGSKEKVSSDGAAGIYRLVALSSSGGLEPDRIEGMSNSNWSALTQQVDFIIVSPQALADRLEPLAEARKSQGLNAIVVPFEELADEFNYGSGGPQAINAMLKTAIKNWPAPAPRFLLLVGEASYDFHNYLGLKYENVVPTFLTTVAYGGETVSDSRLVDVDDDGRPDMAVGRWPASAPEEVDELVRRTLAYDEAAIGQTSTRSLFAADGVEALFAELSEDLIQSAGLETTAVLLDGVSAEALIEAWNQGAWLVNYTGHGSLNLWGKSGMLSVDSLDRLQTPGRPPIVTQLTCLTGLFAHPEIKSLAEQMLLMDRGPVAVIAATSLTLSVDQEPFGLALLSALADPSVVTVGEALLLAQKAPGLASEGGQEVVDTFVLLGDPSLTIARP
ncbi:MAG: hypothetical protein JXA42_07500 [Anaerolineales bacterium]|nr:hypothetical protein [Anaerolineales bacterium]